MIPILFFYVICTLVLLLSLETKEDEKGLIYLVLSIYTSYIGYYLSFQDADFASASYYPMGVLVVSVILMIVRIWGLLNPIKDEDED